MYDLIDKLKDAYGNSTHKYNDFEAAIKKIKWNATFKADGETYFVNKDFVLTVENLNPFKEAWKPSIMFNDGSMIEF